MAKEYYYLTEEDMKILRETFKIPEERIGDYDRFFDGLQTGVRRLSTIIKNYGLCEMNKDALSTIVKLHGYNYETVEDMVFYEKPREK